MKLAQGGTVRLLWWYPKAWRERYGEELMALMEDSLGERPPPLKFKLSMAWAGLRERALGTGLLGDLPSPAQRSRAGALLILCSWSAFVVAGISFSKASEHFAQAVPATSPSLARNAFSVVAVVATIGGAIVVLGAAAAFPAFLRFLRAGGWRNIRTHALRALVLTVMTIVVIVPLSIWAHHLNNFERNGSDGTYSAAIAVWAVLVAATMAQWTALAVSAGHRIDLTHRVLRLEATLALAVAGAMLAITTAAALWWVAMAKDAPWFLHDSAAKTNTSPFNLQLMLTLALMLAAVIVAGYGVVRIRRSRGAPRSQHAEISITNRSAR